MKVRRKSLHRSRNCSRAVQARRKFRANQRAAKERLRLERLAEPPPDIDASHVRIPRIRAPLFVVTIRCRDGSRARITVHESPFDPTGAALLPSAALVARKVAAVLRHYRPAPTRPA